MSADHKFRIAVIVLLVLFFSISKWMIISILFTNTITIEKYIIDKGEESCYNGEGLKEILIKGNSVVFTCFNEDKHVLIPRSN